MKARKEKMKEDKSKKEEEEEEEGGRDRGYKEGVERAILRHGPYPSYRELIIYTNLPLAPPGGETGGRGRRRRWRRNGTGM